MKGKADSEYKDRRYAAKHCVLYAIDFDSSAPKNVYRYLSSFLRRQTGKIVSAATYIITCTTYHNYMYKNAFSFCEKQVIQDDSLEQDESAK